MKRIWPIVVTGAALAAVLFTSAGAAGAASSTPRPTVSHVTLVLAPYLTWQDLTPTATPTLMRLAENGAIGAANVRARVRGLNGIASPTEPALAISSGAWAIPGKDALSAFVATEAFEGTGTASDAYARIYGIPMGSARIGYLGLAAVQRANDLESTQAFIGTLGSAVAAAGGLTAAVGNSDVGVDENLVLERPAAVAAADALGRVNAGDVSEGLLIADPAAPYGRRTDLARFSAAFDRVEQLAGAHRGPSLVVLDSGDLTRAQMFATQATTEAASAQRLDALRTLDAVVGMASAKMGDDGLVIVVSQALGTDEQGNPQGLGPCIIAGAGWNGYLTSASTHRAGVVTNLDVTATILERLGIKRPVQVLGNPMLASPGPRSGGARVKHLTRLNSVATSVDTAKAGVLNVYIGFAVLLLAVSAVVLSRAHLWPAAIADRMTAILQGAVLLLLAVPISSWLMFLVVRYPSTPVVAVLSLIGVSLAVWVASVILWRAFDSRVPVIGLTALTALGILAEQFVGAPLSFVNFFGYSPLPAARFYGMGNEAASILFGASVAGLALTLDQWNGSTWSEAVRRYGVALLGLVVVGVAAAPFFGANVGVAIWGSIGFGLAWMLINGRRVTWKSIVLMLVGVVVLIGLFAAIDLFGGGEQTHLGRALTSADQGGIEQLWTIIVRKAETNMRVFTRTNWSWVLVSVLAFLGFMRMRPTGDFAETLAENPRFGDAITVTLAAGALAFFTEDSGIVIPALIMLYTGAGTVWLMLTRLRAARVDRP